MQNEYRINNLIKVKPDKEHFNKCLRSVDDFQDVKTADYLLFQIFIQVLIYSRLPSCSNKFGDRLKIIRGQSGLLKVEWARKMLRKCCRSSHLRKKHSHISKIIVLI